jgi:hypothetical protein
MANSMARDASANPAAVELTPVIASVAHPPVPVKGSDGRYHVVYELTLINVTPGKAMIARFDVLDAKSGATVASISANDIAQRLVIADPTAKAGVLGAAQRGLLYLHLSFDNPGSIPSAIKHRFSGQIGDKPYTETVAQTGILAPTRLLLNTPLKGKRYIAGDGCCNSTRHVRAMLPINGALFDAQRFAIDWEQLDEKGRIYAGDPKIPESYFIYGKPAYAVADARVAEAVDGMPNTPPGGFPAGIRLADADGNHVILDLGAGRYALYAHFKPGSVKVKAGDRVKLGQVLGLVGTSGNSSEPHLHFQVSDGATMASNGLPYLLKNFTASLRGKSTAVFDQAILDGKPIATTPLPGPETHSAELPLDLGIFDFAR